MTQPTDIPFNAISTLTQVVLSLGNALINIYFNLDTEKKM